MSVCFEIELQRLAFGLLGTWDGEYNPRPFVNSRTQDQWPTTRRNEDLFISNHNFPGSGWWRRLHNVQGVADNAFARSGTPGFRSPPKGNRVVENNRSES
jgi:hypothetical protein